MKTIFEDSKLKISTTDKDYDFIAVIENKTDKEICIIFDNEECPMIKIGANEWIGLLATDEEYLFLEELKEERFIAV